MGEYLQARLGMRQHLLEVDVSDVLRSKLSAVVCPSGCGDRYCDLIIGHRKRVVVFVAQRYAESAEPPSRDRLAVEGNRAVLVRELEASTLGQVGTLEHSFHESPLDGEEMAHLSEGVSVSSEGKQVGCFLRCDLERKFISAALS